MRGEYDSSGQSGLIRLLAWLVVLAYASLGLVSAGWSAAALFALCGALPLTCIFFPEILAEACRGFRREPLPPGLVFGLGWVILLLPGILAGVLWLTL